ncbi:MAG: ribosome small subunit-dependent GTPase A [Bacteroidia bacterium]|nr:ribosome small subunit-dependent GTPase A [Bacteroidia bacterium]
MAKKKKGKAGKSAPSAERKAQGTVIRSTGKHYQVRLEAGEMVECRLRGRMRMDGIKSTNPVAVGDHVEVLVSGEESMITGLLPRQNYVLRKARNLSKRVHILCANVDQALILFTIDHPVTTLGYVDRLLVSCEAYGVTPVLVFNKVDLLDSEEKQQKLDDFQEIYDWVGYKTLVLSAIQEEYAAQVRELLKDKVSFLVGRSGAGKSTLVNLAEPGLNLKTGHVSEFSGRGTHTTTFAEMFPLEQGGWIIDSPGFKEMEIYDIEKHELSHFFPEMLPLLDQCKFHNCTHDMEPGCAVKAEVETGKVPDSRYHTYLSMLAEIEANKEGY